MDYSTPSFIFLSQDEDDDLYSDDLRPGAPKGQKAASSVIVCFSTESRKPPKRGDGITGWVGRMGLVDFVNEEKQLSVLNASRFGKNIDALATLENSNQESHLQIPGLLVLGVFFCRFFQLFACSQALFLVDGLRSQLWQRSVRSVE